jgi:hypothetical protein
MVHLAGVVPSDKHTIALRRMCDHDAGRSANVQPYMSAKK